MVKPFATRLAGARLGRLPDRDSAFSPSVSLYEVTDLVTRMYVCRLTRRGTENLASGCGGDVAWWWCVGGAAGPAWRAAA